MGVTSLDWHVVGVGDFNGDGISDILLRNDNGTVTDWLGQPNGTLVDNSQHASFGTGADWQIVGTGDFNGDGMSGVLWRRNDGAMSDWLGDSNGSFTVNSAVNITTGSEWQIAGTGDFNGDGRTDVLWRRNDGALSDWLGQQNGGFWINTNFNATAGTEWKVVGTGDFNGDGKADLLWERTDGALSDWLGQANGGFAVNSGISLNAGAGWHVAGVGDFNDDGFSDLLWRKDDGTITNWLGWANGAFTDNSSIASQPVSTDLQVAGVGDFNGDGFSDVLLRNTDGTLETWVGSTGGGILSTSEKLWEDALAQVSLFFNELTSQMADYPANGQGGQQDSYYNGGEDIAPWPWLDDMASGLGWSEMQREALGFGFWDYLTQDTDPEFLLASFGTSGFSAAFGTGNFGSVTEVAGVDNTFVFDMNGVLMQGVWHEGSGVTTGGPNDPIVITQGGYWTLNLVGFGDMSWSQAAGGNYVEATQNWGAAVGVIDPLTHQPVYGASGGILKWPSGINVAAIYNSGLNVSASQAIAADPILFSQNGYWDFQREGGAFHPEFIDASTVAIGLYNAAAGVPLSTILTIENNYAASHSNYPAGTIMNSTYTHLPERNVQNTIIGYQLADHIRQASGT